MDHCFGTLIDSQVTDIEVSISVDNDKYGDDGSSRQSVTRDPDGTFPIRELGDTIAYALCKVDAPRQLLALAHTVVTTSDMEGLTTFNEEIQDAEVALIEAAEALIDAYQEFDDEREADNLCSIDVTFTGYCPCSCDIIQE